MFEPELETYSEYDRFAWFYNRYWGPEFSRMAIGVFAEILLPRLADGARILDLCCGTGQIAAELTARGYEVTGIDGSAAMLEYARRNAPTASFLHADARRFTIPDPSRPFEAVISPFDSLNHLMDRDDLRLVFERVRQALRQDGLFLFDLNIEEADESLGSTLDFVENDNVCIVRSSYRPARRLKVYDVTMFRLEDGLWHRSDLTLRQRYHETDVVLDLLAETGFPQVLTWDARRDLGPSRNESRIFYLAGHTLF